MAGGLWLGLALAGGASRADEDQQALVRLVAIAAIGACLWPFDFGPLQRHWRVFAAAGAAYLLLVLQLIPLPPGLWAALPGHAVYVQIALAAASGGWRPLSLTPDLTLNALLALLPATAAGLAALYLDGRGRMRLAEGIVILACASGLFGLVQIALGGALHLYRESSTDSAVGLFANRNHQAALMACALALVGAMGGVRLREGGDRRIILPLAVSVAGLLLLALLATGSRMGLALGAVGLLAAGWAFTASGQSLWPARAAGRLATAAGATVLLGGIVTAALRSGAAERLARTDVAGETRAAMLQPLLTTASAFMPFGAGFGAFDSIYRQFEPRALLSTIYMNQAHNEPMQLAIEGGLPALVLLGLFLCWWTLTAFGATRDSQPPRRRAIGVAALGVTVILMLSSLVDYPLRTPLLGAVFAVACVELMSTAAGLERKAWRRTEATGASVGISLWSRS